MARNYAGAARVVSDPGSEPKPEGWTRFVCFSDTHGRHDRIPPEHMPEADVLLHAGDLTNTGELSQVQSLSEWLRSYPASRKVVIAGNHDVTFHEEYYQRSFGERWRIFHKSPLDCKEVKAALTHCDYLEDSSVEVLGYHIFGTPWQPEFCDWAFNLSDKLSSREIWKAIPHELDILVVHGPPFGHGDLVSRGTRVGCKELLKAVEQRRIPCVVAGHIHEGYGVTSDGPTLFVNASTCTLAYRPTNPPIVLDVPPSSELRAAARAAAALDE